MLGANSAQAIDLNIRGFGNFVASRSNSSFTLGSVNNLEKRLTFDGESLLGLNLSSNLENNMMFSSQIIARGAYDGVYTLDVDWFFITYRPTENFTLRAGRQINPIYLYSEQTDVGYLYPWVRLPMEVYGLDPLKAFFGLSASYTLLAQDLQWKALIFAGGGKFTINSPTSTFSGSLDNDKGIEFSVVSDHFKVRTGYSTVSPVVTSTVPVTLSVTPSGPINGSLTVPSDTGQLHIVSAGASFDYSHFMGMTEFIRMHSNGQLIRDSTGMYGTLGYHLLPSVTPYVTYSWQGNLNGAAYIYPNSSVSTTRKTDQHSWMAGINYRVNLSMVLKAEYMRTLQNFADSTKNFESDTITAAINFLF